MAQATHAYAVFHGSFLDHPEEYWQVGVRFHLLVSGDVPLLSGTLSLWDVEETDVARDETAWTIHSLFNAKVGLTDVIAVDDWLNDQLGPAGLLLLSGCYISSQVTLHGVKVSPINGAGHVVGLRTAQLEYKSPVPHGPTDVPMLPAECSVAVSWKTPVIGRKGRGRIYLPPTGSAILSEDGNLASAQTIHIANGAVAFLQQTAITPTGPGSHWALPVVTGEPFLTYGQIVAVSVGSIVDSQRRRRRSMVEVRTTEPVSYG
jgi:hypothetical protein